MLKIDTHAHYLPRDWPDLAAKYGDNRFPVIHHGDDGRHRIYKDGKFFREIWPKTWDPQIRIDDYAGFGVQVQVLSTVPVMFSEWARPHQALELHRALNDHMAQTCRDYPRHYAGIGTVPLQSPQLAIRELERCMDELGLQGVQIGSHINGPGDAHWNLDARELFEFFQAASDLGAAILVHPWDMMGTDTMPKYWLPWLVGMPAEQSRAACCLVFGGVLERLPALRIARRYFADDEVAALTALADAARDDAFLRLWCAKEAVLKAHGHGLSFGLHRLAFDPADASPRLLRCDPALGAAADWRLHALDADAHVAVVARRDGILPA